MRICRSSSSPHTYLQSKQTTSVVFQYCLFNFTIGSILNVPVDRESYTGLKITSFIFMFFLLCRYNYIGFRTVVRLCFSYTSFVDFYHTFIALSLFAKLLMMERDSWKRELPVSATSEISWLTAMMIWMGKGAKWGQRERMDSDKKKENREKLSGWEEERKKVESKRRKNKYSDKMLWGTYVLTEDREAGKLSSPSVFKLFKHTLNILHQPNKSNWRTQRS